MNDGEIKQITDYIDIKCTMATNSITKAYEKCGNFYHLLQFRSNMPIFVYHKTLVQISDIIKDNFAFADKYGVLLIKNLSGWGIYISDIDRIISIKNAISAYGVRDNISFSNNKITITDKLTKEKLVVIK
jgi:hypothetical protein